MIERRILFRVTTWSDGPDTLSTYVRGIDEKEGILWSLSLKNAPQVQNGEQIACVEYDVGSGKPVVIQLNGVNYPVRYAVQHACPPLAYLSDKVRSAAFPVPNEVAAGGAEVLYPEELVLWAGKPGINAFAFTIGAFMIALIALVLFAAVWLQMFYVGIRTAPPSFLIFVAVLFCIGTLITLFPIAAIVRVIQRSVVLKRTTHYLITSRRALVVIARTPIKVIAYEANDLYFALIISGKKRQRVMFVSKNDGEGNFWSLPISVQVAPLLGNCLGDPNQSNAVK